MRDKENLMINNIIELSAVEIMRQVRQEILINPKVALDIISELEKDDRFTSDQYFSCAIMIQKISVLTFLGEHDQIKSSIKKVYKMVLATDDYDINLEGLVRLAAAYYETGDSEQAMRLYTKAYEKEAKADKVTMISALAYNNIAVIYYMHDKFDEAKFYYKKAYDVYKEKDLLDKNKLDNLGLYIYMLVYLSIIEFKTHNNDKAIYYLNILDELATDGIPEMSVPIYKTLKIYYYKALGDKNKVVSVSMEVLDLYQKSKDYFMVCQFLLEFYEHGMAIGLAEVNLIKIIDDNLDILGEHASDNELRSLCLIVLRYAIEKNDDLLMTKYYNKLARVMVKVEKENDLKKSELVDLYIDLSYKKKNAIKVAEQNEQLNELNDKIKSKSIRLKQLYDQSRLITKIGQKITASSNIDSIKKTLSKEFAALMPFESMDLLTEFDEEQLIEKSLDNSVIYYPIKHESIVIAALHIKNEAGNLYTEYDRELIEALAPYIAIAIVNWQNSNYLGEQINSLQKDKKVLRKLLTHHRKLSNIDLLTKIPNRRYFNTRLNKLIKIAKEEKMLLHLYMFDIDNFKIYNDLNGHIKGDEVLIKVANETKKLRQAKNTTLARYGGEEFIAAELSFSHEQAVAKANLVCQAVENLNIKYNNGTDENLTISLGMLSVNYDMLDDTEALIKKVDNLLYEAKNTGKNRAVCSLMTGGN